MTTPYWRIELFGSLRACHDAQVVTRFRTRKTGALLAYLAAHSKHPTRREALISALWPRHSEAAGHNCLRLALTDLRKKLEIPPDTARVPLLRESGILNAPVSSSPMPPSSILWADRVHVRLDPQAFTTDTGEFDSLLQKADDEADEGRKTRLLEQALALCHSDLLPGYDEEWVAGERQRLADARQTALRQLVTLLLKAGNIKAALDSAHLAVKADPLCEHSRCLLMEIYAELKQPDAATRQYRALEKLLKAEMGMAPSPQTRAFAVKLGVEEAPPTASRPAAVATLAPAASLTPAIPAAPPRFAPPPALRGNLPAPTTRFFGQEDSLAQIVEMFGTPHTRLITLTGLGGSGKTRLALAVGESLRQPFEAAVWFVPLAHVSDPHRVLDAVAQALSLTGQSSLPLMKQIARALGASPALLILDNFEHLADEGGEAISALLDAVPGLICLVTSRQKLNLSGEYEVYVAPLPTPQAVGTPERLLEFASVQLFLDRARAVNSYFQMTRENAQSIAALCHYLEGVPLAIELAATYAQAMTPHEMLQKFSSRLSLPKNRRKDTPPRHASLRAMLDWSFQLLDPPLQRFFARLSVLRGGWDMAAAEAVCMDATTDSAHNLQQDARYSLRAAAPWEIEAEDFDALEALMRLRERSLVTMDEVNGQARFHMLETLREYAAERLTSLAPDEGGLGKPTMQAGAEYRDGGEEERAARQRHSAFFLHLAQQAEPYLIGPGAGEWLRRLHREQENLRAALHFLLAPPSANAAALFSAPAPANTSDAGSFHSCNSGWDGLLLAGALWRCWHARGNYDEGREWLERALRLFPDAPADARLKAQRGLGNLACEQGDLERAQSVFEANLRLADTQGGMLDIAAAKGNLGNVAHRHGDLEQARAWREQSLALYRQAGDRRGIALILSNLANLAEAQQDYQGAKARYLESLNLLRALEDWQNALVAHNNLAFTLLHCGEESEARAHLRESVLLARDLDKKYGLLQALIILTALLTRQRQYRPAAGALGCAETLLEQLHLSSASPMRAEYEAECAAARVALGEREYDERKRNGRALSFDQILSLIGDSSPSPV